MIVIFLAFIFISILPDLRAAACFGRPRANLQKRTSTKLRIVIKAAPTPARRPLVQWRPCPHLRHLCKLQRRTGIRPSSRYVHGAAIGPLHSPISVANGPLPSFVTSAENGRPEPQSDNMTRGNSDLISALLGRKLSPNLLKIHSRLEQYRAKLQCS